MSARRQPNEGANDQRNYYVYCVHIHGSCLNAIKDEFKRQIQSGSRQNVFILDLNDVANELNNRPHNSKRHNGFHEHHNTSLMNAVLRSIRNFREEHDATTRQIINEFKFDLYQYWLKDEDDKLKMHLADTARTKGRFAISTANKVRSSDFKKPKFAKNLNESLSLLADESMKKDECTIPIVLREHNRAGKPTFLSKRQYIKDDPDAGKLYIIIVGRMSKNFYLDLLRQDQPLQGIVHYVPAESKYDIMLGNIELRSFIMKTTEEINSSIYELRQEIVMKPVGLFTYDLPGISSCMVTKYGREIFDQLIWSIYDINVLKKQYETYYYNPYRVTDVELPLSVDLKQLDSVYKSRSAQEQFQKNYLPGIAADLATIYAYLDNLFSICGLPDNVLRELESADNDITQYLSQTIGTTCSSITKIPRWERLIVAENNKLLYSMLLYADQHVFRNIYLSCLEYNIARQYVLTPYQGNKVSRNPQCGVNFEPLTLPKYVKYYANLDCCSQRISELLEEYEDYHVDEIYPGCKLYIFKRNHNTLFEDERIVVIPTRLCFRDFALFQKEEFLNNLKTSEMRKTERKKGNRSLSMEKNMGNIDIDENVFVMPNSLKALKTQTQRNSEASNGKSNLQDEPFISESKLPGNFVGLPPDSQILKGYNLGDVRQEVKIKNTKYYYDNGFVKLYEETFCFQDMNKELILCINNNTLFFNNARFQHEGIWNNIRLITKNNISLRIWNDPKECSKIVMNYPNGLTIYQLDMYCEQIWYCNQTPKNEQRRIFTPYGAIIVFYKTEDIILIMRYNGEIYSLYQHKLTEEEQELSENLENSSESLDVGDNLKNTQEGYDKKLNKKRNTKYAKPFKIDFNQRESSESTIDELENTQMSSSPTSITNHLKTSINDELRFLNYISSEYHLNYLHLVITTSQGKRFNITTNGKIYEGSHCNVREWHDYFSNEAYCQRSDGVKMVWTKDNLKCYHKDGSVLTTSTEEGFKSADLEEFESQISQSSFHKKLEEDDECTAPQHCNDQQLENCFSKLVSNEMGKKKKKDFTQFEFHFKPSSSFHYSNYSMTANGIGEYDPTDTRYVSYTCSSCLLQHRHYADVNIQRVKLNVSNSLVLMKITGIDNIRIQTHTKQLIKDKEYHVNHDISGREKEQEMNTKINMWIGTNLHLTMDDKGFNIKAVMTHSSENCINNIESDSLALRLKYSDNINDAFKYMVNEIAAFRHFNSQKTEEIYFMERLINKSTKRGFEFLKTLPLLSEFSNEISNCIIEVKHLKTISELMTNVFEWYEADMNKFPRFKKYQPKKFSRSEQDFPKVLSTNIYVKIPHLLQNTADISKFLEPFDNIHFKKLRLKFKNLLDFHLKPQLQLDLKLLYNSKNWKKRKLEHKQRIFGEQKRTDLYYAMIKHKMYPNYWKFTQNYSSHVSYIDFFDFVQYKCANTQI